MFNRKWTKKEEQVVINTVKKHNGNFSKALDKLCQSKSLDRTAGAIEVRWYSILQYKNNGIMKNKNKKGTRWTPEEDKVVMEKVFSYGANHVKATKDASKELPGRTEAATLGRWHNSLKGERFVDFMLNKNGADQSDEVIHEEAIVTASSPREEEDEEVILQALNLLFNSMPHSQQVHFLQTKISSFIQN